MIEALGVGWGGAHARIQVKFNLNIISMNRSAELWRGTATVSCMDASQPRRRILKLLSLHDQARLKMGLASAICSRGLDIEETKRAPRVRQDSEEGKMTAIVCRKELTLR